MSKSESANELKKTKSTYTESNPNRGKKPNRASVACINCSRRRIRCVRPLGEKSCKHCDRTGAECVLKDFDQRRNPISRDYVSSLTNRVSLLESLLKERNIDLPPNEAPQKVNRTFSAHSEPGVDTRQTGTWERNTFNQAAQPGLEPLSPLSVSHAPSRPANWQHPCEYGPEANLDEAHAVTSPNLQLPVKKDSMLSRLLSSRGHLSFDQLSGRLRYFGPTTNCHVHSESANTLRTQKSRDQTRRVNKLIQLLPAETHHYLMELYWQYYNSVLEMLDRSCFEADWQANRGRSYSPFLHIVVLAIGYKFADKTRPDIQAISLPGRESTLHREAILMLDLELEGSGGIPSIIALILLGELEAVVGRDSTGWLYAGVGMRIAADIGLHLDVHDTTMTEQDVAIRRMTFQACIIHDQFWSLYLGRPTTMKEVEPELYNIDKQPDNLRAITTPLKGQEKSLTSQIYDALCHLMTLIGKITESVNMRADMSVSKTIDENAYLRMSTLGRRFGEWYAALPKALKWTRPNIETAPFSFFVLHQQYHSAIIHLHRPFAMYEKAISPGSEMVEEDDYDEQGRPEHHFSALSRELCTKHAVMVARIFAEHRKRFDTRKIFVSAMQHAGTAAMALVATLAFPKDGECQEDNMRHIECLSASLKDMSHTYQPAERMFLVLEAVLDELRQREEAGASPLQSSYFGKRRLTNESTMRPPAPRTRWHINSSFDTPMAGSILTASKPGGQQQSQHEIITEFGNTPDGVDQDFSSTFSDVAASTQLDQAVLNTPLLSNDRSNSDNCGYEHDLNPLGSWTEWQDWDLSTVDLWDDSTTQRLLR